MSAVDVLAVMKMIAEGFPDNPEFAEASAAMAELMEADRAYDEALTVIESHHREVATQGYADASFFLTQKLAERLVRARMARAAALARCKGEP